MRRSVTRAFKATRVYSHSAREYTYSAEHNRILGTGTAILLGTMAVLIMTNPARNDEERSLDDLVAQKRKDSREYLAESNQMNENKQRSDLSFGKENQLKAQNGQQSFEQFLVDLRKFLTVDQVKKTVCS